MIECPLGALDDTWQACAPLPSRVGETFRAWRKTCRKNYLSFSNLRSRILKGLANAKAEDGMKAWAAAGSHNSTSIPSPATPKKKKRAERSPVFTFLCFLSLFRFIPFYINAFTSIKGECVSFSTIRLHSPCREATVAIGGQNGQQIVCEGCSSQKARP